MRGTPKILVGLAVTCGSVLGTLVTGPTAGARASSLIGANQVFAGLVNATQAQATIDVLCPGPTNTGHPLPNQSVAVSRAPSTATSAGFTGSRGRSVVAAFGGPTTNGPVTFDSYGSRPIPTSLILPCGGTGTVVFSPRPTSKTARNSTVKVTYLNLGVTPAARSDGSKAPNSPHTVTVTQADNGQSVTLHKGDRLDVRLSGPSGFTWTEPVSSDPGVLRRKAGSSGKTASASFLAVSAGTVTVTAIDNPNCYPLCEIASRPFGIDVSVTG
ncbi:MAG TPA: hypothetical protein VN799_06715 [Acidimicrobiales bacterium]|nr:hypothetical protein [Acidimicrobiales bacterium]